MQVFRLLAARRLSRAVSTITAVPPAPEDGDDEGPFFDLDLSSSGTVSSADSTATESGSDSDASSCADLDFVISLQRSRSASPSYERLFFGAGGVAPPQLKFCASEPSASASRYRKLRALSFGSAKAAFYGGRASFSRSFTSARSARLFAAATFGYGYSSPEQQEVTRAPSTDVIRRYLSKISRRLRRAAPGAAEESAVRHLRKSRSALSSSAAARSPPPRRDDSLLEKQDGIASAIAHCKESLHRASLSDYDSLLSRSRFDPGKCEAI